MKNFLLAPLFGVRSMFIHSFIQRRQHTHDTHFCLIFERFYRRRRRWNETLSLKN